MTRAAVKGVVHATRPRALKRCMLPGLCRFCFRRERSGRAARRCRRSNWRPPSPIPWRPEIWEVILTAARSPDAGAPPAADLVAKLDAIAHVGVIRIHSRVPIVDPQRVSDELLASLRPQRAALWLAVHCNHARELSPSARPALARLAIAASPLMGQTVLLPASMTMSRNPDA